MTKDEIEKEYKELKAAYGEAALIIEEQQQRCQLIKKRFQELNQANKELQDASKPKLQPA